MGADAKSRSARSRILSVGDSIGVGVGDDDAGAGWIFFFFAGDGGGRFLVLLAAFIGDGDRVGFGLRGPAATPLPRRSDSCFFTTIMA